MRDRTIRIRSYRRLAHCIGGGCSGGRCAGAGQLGEGCNTDGGGCSTCWFALFFSAQAKALLSAMKTITAKALFKKKQPHPALTEARFGAAICGGCVPAGMKIGDVVCYIDGQRCDTPAVWTATLNNPSAHVLKVWRKGKGMFEITT